MIPSVTLAKALDISTTALAVRSDKGREKSEKGYVERVRVSAEGSTSLQAFSVNLEGCRVTKGGLYREHRNTGTYPTKLEWTNEQSADGYGLDFLVPDDSDARKFFTDLKAVVEKLAGDDFVMQPVLREGDKGGSFVSLNLSRYTKVYVVGETASFTALSNCARNVMPKGSRLKSCLLSIAYFNKVYDSTKPKTRQHMCYPTFNVTHVFSLQPPSDLEIAKEMASRGNTTLDMADDDVLAAMEIEDELVEKVRRQREEEALSNYEEVTTPQKRRRALETPGAPTKKPRS